MTNHNPIITSSAATGSFSENANTTDSDALHLASGTMKFKDSDNNDTHTTSASLKSAVLSSGSVIPADALAELAAAMSSTILVDSNSSGKLEWSFSAEDENFDFLSKNQKLTLTYDIVLYDNHGGMTKKTVTITVTGTDDRPVIDFGVNAVVTEQAGQTLSLSPDVAQIAVHFVDPDLTNTGHTASVIDVSASGATGGLLPGFLGELVLKSFFHIDNVVKLSGSSNGTINATFSAPDLAFDYLAEGETVDIVYTIKLNDNAGMNNTQTVTVTVVGTNDGPKYLSGPDTEHLTEGEELSPAGDLTACGDFLFADIDLSDTHTVSTSAMASRSGGGAVPLTEAELLAALTTEVDPDSTGHLLGEVDWSFALDNDDVAFLSSGETLTITYIVTITDDAGGTDTQTIAVNILGTNDPVVVTSGPGAASLAEFADTTGSAAPNGTTPVPTGTITFADTDLGDTHTVSVTVAAAAWSAGSAVPAPTEADLGAALLTTLNDSTGTGSGSIDWSFSIPDFDLDFLAAGETLTVDYDVAVSDGPTSASQAVTITVDGANDLTVITSGPGSGSVDELPNTSGSPDPNPAPAPTGALSFTDVDLSDTHLVAVTVAAAIWSANPDFVIGGALADNLMVALATTLNDSTGSGVGSVDWSFSVPDADLDFLAAGETLTVTYDVTVSDAFAGSTQTVTITLNGAQDDLVVNPVTVTGFDSGALDVGQSIVVGNLITDVFDSGGDQSTSLSITDVNGDANNVGTFIVGTYGSLLVLADGFYQFIANSSVDTLQEGDSVIEHFDFTVTDSIGRSETTTLDITIQGGNDAPTITGGDIVGQMTEDLGPSVAANGGFETGDLSGWTAIGAHIEVQVPQSGAQFGQYAVRLGATNLSEALFQDVATNAGEHYILTFFLTGDPDSSSNSVTVTWDGVTILTQVDSYGGQFTQYSFEVIGNAFNSTTQLAFSYVDDGTALYLDQVTVESVTGQATQSAEGTLTFADIETADTHTASFFALGGDYVGTFSLVEPLTEGGGSGSVDWTFTVDNADIQFLSQGQSYSQIYTVFVTDDHGASAVQDVTVTMLGTNDAPTAVGDDTVITNAGAGGGVFIPGWALTRNDTDPDLLDTLSVNSITASSGGSGLVSNGVVFFDDATLDASFDYDTTDGSLVSGGSGTVTIDNNPAGTTVLTGTGGNDIIIATAGGETLDGGDGEDILFVNNGAHMLTGGSGDDIFAFQVVPDGLNTITDFDASGNDMLAISAAAFGGGLTPGMDPSLTFESSPDAEYFGFGSLFHYDTTGQTLYYSSDGTTASAIVVAQFGGSVSLQANDLFFV